MAAQFSPSSFDHDANRRSPTGGGRGVVGGEGNNAPTEGERRDVARDGGNDGGTAAPGASRAVLGFRLWLRFADELE
jgi:hypothetical protein